MTTSSVARELVSLDHAFLCGEASARSDGNGTEDVQQLEALYEFSMDQVSQANISRSAAPVENTLQVMRTLKEGWDAVIPN